MNINANKYRGASYGKKLIQLRENHPLSLTHKNPYIFEAAELRGLLYTLPELTMDFRGIFENPSLPLVLDVGCYMGHTVIELAKHNREINVLGLDIKYKRVVKSCRKIKEEQLTNAKIAICDVQEVLSLLPDEGLFGMFAFFPDPWIKRRQQKHRYLNEQFFRGTFAKLSDPGFIWIKTDNKEYFDEIKSVVGPSGFSIIHRLPGTIEPREYRTVFENIFTRQNITVNQLIVGKNSQGAPHKIFV